MNNKKRTRDPHATREALLAAGTDLFAEAGFDGTRIEAIAQRAGVNKAMISYHFGGKLGLYRAILEGTVAGAMARFASADRHRPATTRLELLIADLSAMMLRRPSFPILMLRELLAGAPRLDAELFAHFVRLAELTSEIVAGGAEAGQLRRADPIAVFFGLIGSLVYFHATATARRNLTAAGLLPFPVPDEPRFVEHLQTLFVRGLAPPADGRS